MQLDPTNRALVAGVMSRWIPPSHPDFEDCVQEAMISILRRPHYTYLRNHVIEGLRAAIGWKRRWREGAVMLEHPEWIASCYATPEQQLARMRDEEQEETDRTLRSQWSALPFAERQARILESHRALGTSCPDTLGF